MSDKLRISTYAKPGWASEWPKVEAQRLAKGADKLSPFEYDFRKVPDAELRTCVHYEYARESAKVAQIIEEMRADWRTKLGEWDGSGGKVLRMPLSFRKFTKAHSPMHDASYLIALGGSTGFPRIAWLDLEDNQRAELIGFPGKAIKMHNQEIVGIHPILIAEAVQDDACLPGMTLAAWENKKIPAAYRKIPEEMRRQWLLSVFMMIHSGYSVDEIVADFRKWLLKRHPSTNKTAPDKRGRKSYRDQLNALGAMRLQFYCRKLGEAQDLVAPLRKEGRGLYYSDRTAWNRACKRAVNYFQEVLDLRETDLPIHYSGGWQK